MVIQWHEVSYYHYADDTAKQCLDVLSQSLEAVRVWMGNNGLRPRVLGPWLLGLSISCSGGSYTIPNGIWAQSGGPSGLILLFKEQVAAAMAFGQLRVVYQFHSFLDLLTVVMLYSLYNGTTSEKDLRASKCCLGSCACSAIYTSAPQAALVAIGRIGYYLFSSFAG